MDLYGALCYGLGIPVVFFFAVYAFVFSWWWARKADGNKDTEKFITARGTQQLWRIGWSFYAGAVGAWVIVAPSQYASFAGIMGVVVYAIASGIPILLIALFGTRITRDMPHVFSLSDFMGWRFGPVAKTVVVLVALFNMSIALLAEYTTIGTIFSDFVGSVSYAIIIVIGVLTLLYTAAGGLAVSIATDQVQGIASAILALVVTIFVAVTYRKPIPSPLPDPLGAVEAGYIAIFTLTISLISSTMFSEAMWQRVWASASKRALYGGATIGCISVILLVFLSGFGGWLSLVGGLAGPDTNQNLILMQILNVNHSGVSTVSNWVGVLVVLLALIMNEGAVDSLQNGLAASLSGHFLKSAPLAYTRAAVVFLNIPLVIIGTRGYAVLSLFLVANLLTTCGLVPIILGLITPLRGFVTETGFIVGFLAGILGVTGTGIGVNWNPTDVSGSFSYGANWAWYQSNYDWRPFLAALLCSSCTLLLWCSGAWFLRKRFGVHGPGISGLVMRIPGAKWVTASPNWTPESSQGCMQDGLPRTAARDSKTAAATAAAKGIDAPAAV